MAYLQAMRPDQPPPTSYPPPSSAEVHETLAIKGIAGAPGVATIDGRRAASVELHSASRFGDRVALVRGVTEGAYAVHPDVVVVEGTSASGNSISLYTAEHSGTTGVIGFLMSVKPDLW